jgi:Ran GTPase-activating protein (RanGAP) involved in mRNA processing and transport
VTFTKLNLSDNKIGLEGAASIAHSLLTNVTLTKLNLGNNDIGPEGAYKCGTHQIKFMA